MISTHEQKLLRTLLYLGTISVSLLITPSYSYEPVDLPKLLLLVTLGGLLFGFILNNIKFLINGPYRLISILLVLLSLNFLVLLIIGDAPFNQQFYGAFGRNTGFLAYFSLVLVFIGGIISSQKSKLQSFMFLIFITGLANSIYGILQTTKNDPVKWNNPYNSFLGFLGNPDFASAFLGISAAAVFSLLIAKSLKPTNRALILFYEVIAILLIIRSHAQQGLIVLGLGIAITIFLFLLKTKRFSRIFLYLYSMLTLALGLIVTLGIFRIGPLASKLYKVSVRQRGFYWHAAIEMLKRNPMTGVGIDSYGDNYLTYRSKNAEFFSSVTQSNAAHNVYLDIASNGGIPLFVVYCAITVYVLYRGVVQIRRLDNFDPFFTGIFVAWVGYQAQSIISINQLGLAVWGWILGGLIVGYSFLDNLPALTISPKRVRQNKNSNLRNSLIMSSIGGIMGFLIIFPMFMADHNYRIATGTRDANAVIAAAQKSPLDLNRTLNAAQILASNHLNPQALDLTKRIVLENPKSYNAWVLLSQITAPGSSDHKQAIKQMQKLNPRDKNIK